MQMVIIDPVAPKPYSAQTLKEQPLGGTEATVVRIAEAMDAVVLQHNRSVDEGRYRALTAEVAPTLVVALREAAAALAMVERFPAAHHLLWLHDLAGPNSDRGRKLLTFAPRLAAAGVTIVCVSDFHAAEVRSTFAGLAIAQRPHVVRVYNPVDVAAGGDAAYDPNKLVFFSSPHKGLAFTLSLFNYLHARQPALRLYIANPGYLPNETRQWPGVVNLGAVPHHVILGHVRTALCTLYPNYVYPETFGLALAESNALGTPVLTHAIGAAAEVLNGDGQLIDVPAIRGVADSVFWRLPGLRVAGEAALCRLGFARAYAKRIDLWRDGGGRPAVVGRPGFAIEAVCADWRALAAAGKP
jgi:glycosyltransferase involved in cell wall biosynthesis